MRLTLPACGNVGTHRLYFSLRERPNSTACILDTLDDYLNRNPHTKISLLHIDTDVYEPAKYALEKLFDKVVKGGVIVFDDYATIEGETKAIDEFFRDSNYILKKFTFSHTKPSYIIKE